MDEDYLESAKKQFEYYKSVGDKTFNQIDEAGLFWKYNEESNSIAVIVKHLWGNMLSRFTDFLTSDGEKEWRNRDAEFEEDIQNKEELLSKWEEGWGCLFDTLDSLKPADMQKLVYIRNMGHTVVEALNRQMAHYAYHAGQIAFVGRMVSGPNWKSLTIPKGESKAFNEKKFSRPKRREHFSKEFLDKKDDT